jgi:methyl-accepting chemotaxis protein
MIAGIQAEAKGAVDSILLEIAHIDQSAKSATRASESIAGIIRASDNVKDMIGNIAVAARQQSAATEAVDRSLRQIAHFIDLSTLGTQDSAKASTELSRLAIELQQHVFRFQLDRSGLAETSYGDSRVSIP